MNRTPTLAKVLETALDVRLAETRVALPAKIVSFDAATQLASVQPLLRESFEQEDGTETTERLGVISDVPVQFPGTGSFVITFPVEAGTPCWLVFADRSLDRWIARGEEVDPVDVRRHHLSDAVAFLGIRSKAAALAEFDEQAVFVGASKGIRCKSAEVHLGVAPGVDATDAVALVSKVSAALSALKTAINGAPVVPGDGGASFKTALMTALATWPPADLGSAIVKAD